MPVAHGAEGEVGRVEADRRLPRHAVGQVPHAGALPDVLLAEGAVGEDGVTHGDTLHGGTRLHHLADAHVPEV